jgi:hypothetical protein
MNDGFNMVMIDKDIVYLNKPKVKNDAESDDKENDDKESDDKEVKEPCYGTRDMCTKAQYEDQYLQGTWIPMTV